MVELGEWSELTAGSVGRVSGGGRLVKGLWTQPQRAVWGPRGPEAEQQGADETQSVGPHCWRRTCVLCPCERWP